MKIICVGYLEGSGGAERQITLLANELAEKGNEIYLAVMARYEKKYDISEKVKVIDLTQYDDCRISLLGRIKALHDLYQDIRPDATVHFWLQSVYLTAIFSKRYAGELIYSERGDPGDKEYSGILGFIRKLSFKRVDGFVFQSKGARDYFGRSIREKSTIISNPVFIKREDFPEVRQRRKAIVTMGRLHEQKNQKLLINAFSKIAGKYSEYNLEIYGDGELRDQLQNQIMSLHLEHRVFLLGAKKNVHDLIYNASLFVLTSDYEGLPNALIEAMALGLPCISTDCRPGGAKEIICNGIDGYIVPLNNVSELASRMDNLLSNPKESGKIGDNAKENIRRYQKDSIYEQWNKFITKVIENAKDSY